MTDAENRRPHLDIRVSGASAGASDAGHLSYNCFVPLAHRTAGNSEGCSPLPKEPIVYQGDRASGLLRPVVLGYVGYHASILALLESSARSNREVVPVIAD